ncbi:Zinc finger C2H2-type,Zinc finger, RING/FYVE/PHD-type [Cinara cedri]|uniref:Zinc finger C2H2-type,Zinc finger, RING/FYVE/PHD-type n=1 Tax=Cinara cedri TaxID=506608 RepID=A0A5E4MD03_9HEMI|nr:Zinc finger C2H2-type,Zinc finger, RING/FYVE/PHD-type [Cinara cedri]
MHRGSLQRHSKFECGVTPKFCCGFCGRRFSQRSNLSRHAVDIHRKALEQLIQKHPESGNKDDNLKSKSMSTSVPDAVGLISTKEIYGNI